MKNKTGLRAGDGTAAGGGEVLTAENAAQAVQNGIEAAGVPEMQETLREVAANQAAFEARANSGGDLRDPNWWLHDDLVSNGIPSAALPGVKDRVRADFKAHRGEDEAFPAQNAARSLRCLILSAVSEKGQKGLELSGAKEAMTPIQFATAIHGESHPVTQGFAGKLVRHQVSSDILESDKLSRIGVTIPDAFLPGFVPFLRARSVFLAAGPVQAPLDRGKLSFLVQTAGASFAYVATETSAPARTSLDFAERAFSAKYLKGLVVWSIAAVRRSSIVSDALILNDMLSGGADAVDQEALLGDGAAAGPLGLRNLINAGHVVSATVLAASQTNAEHIQNVELDFRNRLNAVVGVANITPGRMALFMSYREFLYFMTARTNDGAPAWPSVAVNGTLLGMPIFWTGRIATDGATPANIGSTIIGMDMTQAVFAEEEGLEVDVSFEATITDTGAASTYNLWERRSAAAQLMATHDVGVLRDLAGFVLIEVNYGGIALT